MTLGQRLKDARIAAGLSQRQLCGEIITRNMLSQIENGMAQPSMDTLCRLAERLEKPVGYFLDDGVSSPNGRRLLAARQAYQAGDYQQVWELLREFQLPDPLLEQERSLLLRLSDLELARQAMDQGRMPYARELLHRAGQWETVYPVEENRRQLLLQEAGEESAQPSLDAALLVAAEAAKTRGDWTRAGALLEAVEEQSLPRWQLAMGQVQYQQHRYAQAAELLQQAESAYPGEAVPLLEICWRELGDFEKAYRYACKQRERTF